MLRYTGYLRAGIIGLFPGHDIRFRVCMAGCFIPVTKRQFELTQPFGDLTQYPLRNFKFGASKGEFQAHPSHFLAESCQSAQCEPERRASIDLAPTTRFCRWKRTLDGD